MKRRLHVLKGSLLFCFLAFLFTSKAQQPPTSLTDEEIAWIALSYAKIDIDYATLALLKTDEKSIVDYAKGIHEDNSGNIIEAEALFQELTLNPMEHPYSEKIWNQARQNRDELISLSESAFNDKYIHNEIAFQEDLLHAVNTLLIPQSTTPALQKFLKEKVKPTVEKHNKRIKSLKKEK